MVPAIYKPWLASILMLAFASLHNVRASPSKWSWGPIHTTSLPSNFPNSRLPHAPPIIQEKDEINVNKETNSKLRSLCSLGNDLECPSGISKGVSNQGFDIPSSGPPISLVRHHHIHAHVNKDALNAKLTRQSKQLPSPGGQPFPHTMFFGGQDDVSTLPQSPFPTPTGHPFLDTKQQFPQLDPSRQQFSTGFQTLGPNQASSLGNIQPTFAQLPQVPSSHLAALPTDFPQNSPVSPEPVPQGGQFLPSLGQQLLPPNLDHAPNTNHALVLEDQSSALFSDVPPYREQCQCAHPSLCGVADVVPRLLPSDPLPHLLIDPRSLGTEVLSNATTSDQDEIFFINETRSNKEDNVSRMRRNTVNVTEANPRNGQNHLLGVYYPGSSGCQGDHVCCRELFSSALQSQFACGVRNAQGVLGRSKAPKLEKGESEFGEHPWQAAILMDAQGESVYVCGAALITNRHALTAAHCVNSLQSSVLKVRLGEWDVSGETEFFKHLDVPVAGIHSHPQYYAGNLINDIALITLQDIVDFDSNPHIYPVCLPDSSDVFLPGQYCYSTGWGKNSFGSDGQYQRILKEIELPIVSHQECEQALRGTRLGHGFSLHEGMMCAGGEALRDACTGDGGGPLVCQGPDGTAYLSGLVSWGIGCGQLGVPGVYVNVPYYIDWILTYLKS